MIHVIIDLCPLLLCYVKSWNIIIIYKNIMHHLDDNNILFANQHGFRKGHSCETQLILAVEELAMNLDHGGQMDMIILDFSKAFDKVPHQHLISKLQFYGIKEEPLHGLNHGSLVDHRVS